MPFHENLFWGIFKVKRVVAGGRQVSCGRRAGGDWAGAWPGGRVDERAALYESTYWLLVKAYMHDWHSKALEDEPFCVHMHRTLNSLECTICHPLMTFQRLQKGLA